MSAPATSNKEEMQEQNRFPEPPPTLRKADNKRCHHCNGRFGLIRHRFALKHFCSKRCLDGYKTRTERRILRIKEWANILPQKS
jgi:hypothetical protein